MVQLR